jgi:hypothetical protein
MCFEGTTRELKTGLRHQKSSQEIDYLEENSDAM